MNLSPRLEAIVSSLDLPARVADIGTDHAYIPIYLAQNTACPTIIASDCNKQPYKAALDHIKKEGLEDKIDVRLGDGLSVLHRYEVDTVIIAGMGSTTIKNIINDDYQLTQTLDRLVLQPMAGSGSLRRWLVKNNFKLIDEKLVKEGDKLYQILVAKPGTMKIKDEFLIELGPILLKKKGALIGSYFEALEEKWKRVIAEINANAPEHPKIKELEEKLSRLKEVRECL